MTILVGLIGCAVGVLYLKYSAQISNFTGSIGFAERYLGAGGTYTLHKVIGVLIILLSIWYAFGGLQTSITGTVGRLN